MLVKNAGLKFPLKCKLQVCRFALDRSLSVWFIVRWHAPFERVKVRGRDLTSPRLNLVVGIRKNIKSKKVAKREKTSGIKMKEMPSDE